jgi:hypothetical protein
MKKFKSYKRIYYIINEVVILENPNEDVKFAKVKCLPKKAFEIECNDFTGVVEFLARIKTKKKTTLIQCRIDERHACKLRDMIKDFKKSIK